MNNLKINIFLFILIFSSCSGLKKQESIQDKMSRYNPKKEITNIVPQLYVIADSSIYIDSQRSPASINSDQFGKKNRLSHSNKRLYFLSLLSQYETFSKYSDSSVPNIKICPNFHSSVVDYREKNPHSTSKSNQNFVWESKDPNWLNNLAYFPELSLPVTYNGNGPKVIDVIKKDPTKSASEIMKIAINIHLAKTRTELIELCELGASNNYYIFENMHRFVKDKKYMDKSPESMKILLKTTIFSNIVLLNSLKRNFEVVSRTFASNIQNDIFSSEIINRFKVPWTRNYFYKISKGK